MFIDGELVKQIVEICTVKKKRTTCVILLTRKFIPSTISWGIKKQVIEWHIEYDTVYAKQKSHKRIQYIFYR